MTDNSKILDRINKLLSKTVENGCTPEEAAAAAAKAQELIAKHHIDMREGGEDIDEDVCSCLEPISKTWQGSLAKVIADNMCCEVILHQDLNKKKTLVFMGKETDLEAALTVYDKLLEALKAGLKAEVKRQKEEYGHANKVETSFSMGFISAVRETMGEQCRALALVVPEDVTAKLNEQFPHLTKARSRKVAINGTAYNNGKAAGRSAAGRKQITG